MEYMGSLRNTGTLYLSLLNFHNSGSTAICHYLVKRSNTYVNASTYSIKGNSNPLWITASSTEEEVELTLQEKAASRILQTWELIFPMPSIPTGWLRLRNDATNATLAHRFTHIPPFLIPVNPHQATELCNSNCYNGSCDKATQWALVHGQLHDLDLSEDDSTSNYYVIMNRLTGGLLADCGGSEGLTQVSCWSKHPTQWMKPNFVDNALWEVQAVAPPHIWGFRNRETRRVLAEIVDNQYVSCVDRSGGDRQAFIQWRAQSVGLIFITCLEYLS